MGFEPQLCEQNKARFILPANVKRVWREFDVTSILLQHYSQVSWTELNCCKIRCEFCDVNIHFAFAFAGSMNRGLTWELGRLGTPTFWHDSVLVWLKNTLLIGITLPSSSRARIKMLMLNSFWKLSPSKYKNECTSKSHHIHVWRSVNSYLQIYIKKIEHFNDFILQLVYHGNITKLWVLNLNIFWNSSCYTSEDLKTLYITFKNQGSGSGSPLGLEDQAPWTSWVLHF